MPQYWLKPLGTTEPHAPLRDDWTSDEAREFDLPRFELITGPATPTKPPQMGKGDRVLLHAVIHVKLIGEGEILDNPQWKPHGRWGGRFPWAYPCRLDLWVPRVADGVHTPDVAPKKAMGRIQTGAAFAALTRQEYEALVDALSARPTVQRPAATLKKHGGDN